MNSSVDGVDESQEIAELLGATAATLAPQTQRDLKPWHKPRKQWIREEQWAKNCLALMAGALKGQSEFTYLSLPGPDLLDVRFLSQTCFDANKKLKFLGFNNPVNETPEDQLSLIKGVAEICQSDHVNKFSSVVPDRLENLALRESVANRTLAEFGSLDAINIDLCNSILGHVPLAEQASYYDALHALFEHQKNNRTKPFLLFLTTKTDRGALKESALAKLAQAVKKNLKNPDFKNKLSNVFKIEAFEVNNLIDSKKLSAGWTPKKLSRFVYVSLAKWMLGLLWDGHPSWSLKILDSCEYHVYSGQDMLSISCLCVPVRKAAGDQTTLSKHTQEDVIGLSERQCGMELLDCVNQTFDLDKKLNLDSVEFTALLERAARLMESAGYDGEHYKQKFRN